jgi:outer membrane protein TolC
MEWLITAFGLIASQTEGALSLARALELARAHHQTSRLAEARIERAEAVQGRAVSALLPEVAVTGRYVRQPERAFDPGLGVPQVIQEENLFDGRASIDLTLLEARKLVELERAASDFEAVKLRARESERALGFEVARIFLAVLSSEQVRAAAQNRIAVAKQATEHARKRFDLGLAGENDVTRAQLELAAAELAAADSEASAREVRLALERLVGPPARSPLLPPEELSTAPAADAAALIAHAKKNRRDLAALSAERESAHIAAGEPLWELIPTLSFDAWYELTTQQAFVGENQGWGVAVSAEWTLYDRGLRYRERQERSAAAREADLELERAMDDLTNEVARALVGLERAQVALSRAETRAALAEKNAEEVSVRYREGVASAFELADAGAEAFTAGAELARARFDLAASVLEIRRIAGDLPL